MEIATQQNGDVLDVKVKGRLDNYWTEHLRRNLEEMVRNGAHTIRLNLSEISFLSSAGVGLLVQCHTQFQGIGGSFLVTNPSERVKRVLELCKLSPILLAEANPAAPTVHKAEVRRLSSPVGSFEVTEWSSGKTMACQRVGDPSLLTGCRFTEHDCRMLAFPPTVFGLGLGAFGEGFDDTQARFGEFLAVGGAAAYLPTDGTNAPDFMVASGELIPELNVLYGLSCEAGFTHLMRFETSSAESPISLAEVVRTALEVVGAPTIGLVMLAESSGLVGAALRRSPAAAATSKHAPFQYPEIRSWLSFSAERLYSRSLALVSGVAAGSECPSLDAFLRPLSNSGPIGHFHAAAFSYRPLKKGSLDLTTTVQALFATETLQGVLHLLTDDRAAAGAHQSEFVRGACWIGAVAEIR
jgi:anti-anti-sigma factor